ncbi:hypothetical protein DENIS_4241 [Desulfonema ishimotonii]|uniref:RsbT co-antagonist protein RsbRD N-terminal domain-containing protein n=2 Tax=Desulfonema ishimotonii TaxID=45657 RepID=A0A401G206_9BACT|nr:hypothetical protein DENIS_4241 [Desulfonema ishimotonii]
MVVDTYPADTSRFLKGQKDPFANPVGSTTIRNLEALFDELLKPETDLQAFDSFLDPIIRIRAVQTVLAPAQAVGFTYFLKKVIREELKGALSGEDDLNALLAFELKIDDLSLTAFNIYTKCREAVSQLRVNLERNRIYKAFSRAGLVDEIPDDGPDLKEEKQ